ncbi:hypothetical protein ACWCQN_13020 [Streptomyces sp. NPDC001984]
MPCPHACGYVGTPEIRPSILYGLIPQISPSATPANPALSDSAGDLGGVRRRHQGRPDKATAPVCAHLIYGIVLGVKLTARCPDILVLHRSPDRKVQSLRLRKL